MKVVALTFPTKVSFDNKDICASIPHKMLNQCNQGASKSMGRAQILYLRYDCMALKPARDRQSSSIKAALSSELPGQRKPIFEDAKKELVRAVANTNRGKNATLEQRKRILKMLFDLESRSPTENPINSPLLSGFWSLLYTAPIDEIVSDKYAGTEEGPFLARVKPLTFGSIKQTRSCQVIDVKNGVAKNIAEFLFLGKNGTLTIEGEALPSSAVGKETTRLEVVFKKFFVRIGGWASPKISLQWMNPQGWVDTTYLDEDMRVGRGDKGSIFLAVRSKE